MTTPELEVDIDIDEKAINIRQQALPASRSHARAAKRLCVALLSQKCGWPVMKIADELRMHRHTVVLWKDKDPASIDSFLDAPRSGRPTLLNGGMKAWVVESLQQEGQSSSAILKLIPTMFQGYSVSRQTVARAGHEVGLRWKVPRKVPLLTEAHRTKRLAFCHAWLGRSADVVRSIVFSDEKIFNLTGPILGAWKPVGQPHEYPVLRHGSVRVLVWGGVGWFGKTDLYMLVNDTLTADLYCNEVLQKYWLPFQRKICRKNRAVHLSLVEDGAPVHTARVTKAWHEKHNTVLVHGPPNSPCEGQWPPNSPDINGPIENLWGDMAVAVGMKKPRNKDELLSAIKEAWEDIGEDRIRSAVQGWQRRLKRIIDLQGFTYRPPLASEAVVEDETFERRTGKLDMFEDDEDQ